MMKPMLKQSQDGSLDSIQMQWFRKKQPEELYDVQKDPFNIHNIVRDTSKNEELKGLRRLLKNFLFENPDMGQMPEADLISLMWPENKQPETSKPVFRRVNEKIKITDSTPGASIVYMISSEKDPDVGLNAKWKLYTNTVTIPADKFLLARAERIGFKTSKVSIYQSAD